MIQTDSGYHPNDNSLTEFDDSVWNAVIANIIVFHDGSMVFQFKDGTEIKE